VRYRMPILLLVVAVTACGYGAPDEVINGQAVAAVKAPSALFAPSKATYMLAPTIRVHDNTSGTNVDSTQPVPAELANQVDTNMQAYGYTKVPFSTNVSAASYVLAFQAFLGSNVYGGYYCDWYYYGYPYGCGYYYAGTYNTGTVVLQMADLTKVDPPANCTPGSTANCTLPSAWAAVMYGIAGNQAYNAQIVLSALNRAFQQSPYLKIN